MVEPQIEFLPPPGANSSPFFGPETCPQSLNPPMGQRGPLQCHRAPGSPSISRAPASAPRHSAPQGALARQRTQRSFLRLSKQKRRFWSRKGASKSSSSSGRQAASTGEANPKTNPPQSKGRSARGAAQAHSSGGGSPGVLGGICSGNVEHEDFGGAQRESRLPVSTPGPCNYATINPQCVCRARRSTRKPRVSTNPPGNVALVNRWGKTKKKGEQKEVISFF